MPKGNTSKITKASSQVKSKTLILTVRGKAVFVQDPDISDEPQGKIVGDTLQEVIEQYKKQGYSHQLRDGLDCMVLQEGSDNA